MTNNLETGGSERQFSVMASALNGRSFRIQLGCLARKGAFLPGLGELPEFAVGGSFFNWQAQKARFALARHLKQHEIAVAHSFDFYTNLMLIPTARMAGVSVVIGSQRQLGDLLGRWQFRGQNLVFRLCDRVVCNSRAAADRLRDAGIPESKLVVIPNALPEEFFAESRPVLPREPGLQRIGLIGRMNSPVKNHPAFLRAAARLAPKYPRLQFVLAGDGPLRPGLERMAKDLGIAGRVNFLGDCRDIPAVLASLDVSVLPSSSESLSNAILESMAAGVPVVATRVGGNPEIVTDGETGLLVAPGDDDQLVAALERMLTDEGLRKACGRKSRSFTRAECSLQQICKRYEDLYASLLAEKRRRPGPGLN
jgi:glycosyltransferase involved in cell wall biosynthesis